MRSIDGKSGLKDFEGILQRFGIGCRSGTDAVFFLERDFYRAALLVK